MVRPMTFFPPSVLAEATYWGRFLGEEWIRDFTDAPTQIHTSSLAADGTLEWQRDFANWLDGKNDSEARQRTTKVMRRLRRASPRAYEVAYRLLIQGESFEDVTKWLNERAIRNNIPLREGHDAHYRIKDAVALFLAAVTFCRHYW